MYMFGFLSKVHLSSQSPCICCYEAFCQLSRMGAPANPACTCLAPSTSGRELNVAGSAMWWAIPVLGAWQSFYPTENAEHVKFTWACWSTHLLFSLFSTWKNRPGRLAGRNHGFLGIPTLCTNSGCADKGMWDPQLVDLQFCFFPLELPPESRTPRHEQHKPSASHLPGRLRC